MEPISLPSENITLGESEDGLQLSTFSFPGGPENFKSGSLSGKLKA